MRLLRFLSIRLCLRLLNPNNYRFLVCKSEKISQKLRGLFLSALRHRNCNHGRKTKPLRAMKKAVIILSGLLLCAAAATAIGQKKMLFAQGRTPRSPRKTPCGTHCELREDDGLAGSLAQLPVQSPDDAAPAGGPHAPDCQPLVQRRHLGRHGRHLSALYQRLRTALLHDGNQLYGIGPARLHDRTDPRRVDGDVQHVALFGGDLHLHVRDILPHGRCQSDDQQPVVQPGAVYGFDFAALLT